MRLFSYHKRPPQLGPYPLERLRRGHVAQDYQREKPLEPLPFSDTDNPLSLANAMVDYIDLLDRQRDGPVADKTAPIPDDPVERANHLKSACYYFDASQVGACSLPANAYLEKAIRNPSLFVSGGREVSVGARQNAMASSIVSEAGSWQQAEGKDEGIVHHTHALVILVEHPRDPDPKERSEASLVGTLAQRAALRAAEVSVVIAHYLRILGYEARSHTETTSDIDHNQILLASGLGKLIKQNGSERVVNPYLKDRFGISVVTTNLEFAGDQPLAEQRIIDRWRSHGPSWWLGVGGTKGGWQREAYRNRAFYRSLFPMEKLKRVDEPTNYIDTPNVPRLPKRHDMFVRAALGDLGAKAERALANFRMNRRAPLAHAMMMLLGGLVPLQYGETSADKAPGTDDPEANAKAIKAALYYLGADVVGICEIPHYAWYSHDFDGSEIKPYHKYAITVLINQGHETMDGASGDDWIGSAQGMRAYMRASLLGGVVGAQIRNLGHEARSHSVVDQDVLHIPLMLLSGLGEVGRIGEVVVNPFIGPSSKTAVITTNMPLAVDKPIDFGLEDFCNKCNKCARECPCAALPFGDKIRFNGYDIWKPDVDKCARYRATNIGGTMCGRCTKTCPYNLEGVLAERPFLWSAINLPFTRKWIAQFDDKIGNGSINPVKKWWWDLDTSEDGTIEMGKRTNQRELFFRAPLDPDKQALACFPAEDAAPPGIKGSYPIDRKKGVERYRQANIKITEV